MSNYIERYWRDAKPEDAIKEPPMVARFRAGTNQEWVMDTLQGIDRSEPSKWRGKDVTGRLCQVYDAPDPGEGWRLIDTENEEPQDGDEIYDARVGLWTRRIAPFTPNVLSINRRRITPTVTYVPFTWEDVDEFFGRTVVIDTEDVKRQFVVQDCCKSTTWELIIQEWAPDWLLENAKFKDTGKPFGKEVFNEVG